MINLSMFMKRRVVLIWWWFLFVGWELEAAYFHMLSSSSDMSTADELCLEVLDELEEELIAVVELVLLVELL